MADAKTTDLVALTTPAQTDVLYIVDVSAGASGSKKITVSDLHSLDARATLLPSGDATGATDRAAINTALAAGKDVFLAPASTGTYYIDQEITVPQYRSVEGLSARKQDWSVITFVGSNPTGYMFALDTGEMRNLFLSTGDDCGGIHLYQSRYMAPLENIRIYQGAGANSGGYMLRLENNWATEIRNIHITSGSGLFVYATACNSVFWHGWFFNAGACSGTNERAFKVEDANNCKFETFAFESIDCGTNPMVECKDTAEVSFANLRFEDNDHGNECIYINGTASTVNGKGFSVRGCTLIVNEGAGDNVPTQLIKADDQSAIELSDFVNYEALTYLICLNNGAGKHHRPVFGAIEHLSGTGPNPSAFVNLTGTASYADGYPGAVIITSADAAAPNNTIYYSTDQTALCYKNAAGTVTTIDQTAT